MATNGSFRTSAYDSRCLEFAWTRTSYDTVNNTSTISWTLTARGTGQYRQYTAGNFKVIIDGEQVYYSTTRITTTDGLRIASGTKTIKHNADGTRSFSASAEAGIYYTAVNCSGSGSWTLETIPRAATIREATNFNDKQNPKIVYTNHLGDSVTKLEACISLTGERADIAFKPVDKTGTEFVYELTDAEREVLTSNTIGSNSRTVVFILRTWLGSEFYDSRVTKTFTVVEANPQIVPVITDTNETTTTLTGNSGIIVLGYSDVIANIFATAQKGATIVEMEIDNGDEVVKDQSVVAFGKVENSTFSFSATDNRGNTTKIRYNAPCVEYFEPTCNQKASIELTGETTASITLSVTGSFFNGSFGAEDNTPKVEMAVLQTDGEFSAWLDLEAFFDFTLTVDGNNYKAEGIIENISYNNSYTIKTRVVDALASAESSPYTLKVNPVFDWSSEDFSFNVPVSIQGKTIADFVIERGQTAMGSNGMWYWQKWKSGKAECWGQRNFGRMAITGEWGILFESAELTQDFPTGLFSVTPTCQITIAYLNGNGGWLENGVTRATASHSQGFQIVRPTSTTVTSSYIDFYAVGVWN